MFLFVFYATKAYMFQTDYDQIIEKIESIDPISYGKTRNFIDGDVTYLSPYISRGVISTKQLLKYVLDQNYSFYKIEKFIQELAWRDYWQQVWVDKGEAIHRDLKHAQPDVDYHGIPKSILEAKTGIQAIDDAIEKLESSGYMHNHLRMYTASIACNIGRCHWRIPAQWMYYYLKDGDWASNALSWQWVAGSNSNKKYFANQSNINKYCKTRQRNTFLDVEYGQFDRIRNVEVLEEVITPKFETPLPDRQAIEIDRNRPTTIYNYYNLDPLWREEMDANRVLLLEPEHFENYPISKSNIDFMLDLGLNIENLQVFVGSFEDLISTYKLDLDSVYFKEHPTNTSYKGNEDSRDWMFPVKGYYPSFFSFWKRCKKYLRA